MKKLCIALIILAVGFSTYYFFTNKTSKELNMPPDEGGLTFCTEEALMCPDGSFVGREGKICEFKSCPSIEYVEGVLEQNTEGFRLVMGTPENIGQEVSYTMPIEIKISNTLKDFVNKKVRAYGSFSTGNNFVSTTIELAPESNPTTSVISVGESKYINGVNITLNKITADSRCPIDVQCITAGFISADVTLKSDTDKETKSISSGQAPVPFDAFQISILDVLPPKNSKIILEQADYKITFVVEKLKINSN